VQKFLHLLEIFYHCQTTSHFDLAFIFYFSSLDFLGHLLKLNQGCMTTAPSFCFSSQGFLLDPYLTHLSVFIRSEQEEPVQVFREK